MPQTLVFPGGNKITLTYDDFMRVEQRLLQDQAGNGLGSAVYDYDLESNVEKMTTEHGIYDFGYDDLYRLNLADYPETIGAQDESFFYDGVGNRKTRTTEIASETPVVETSGYNNHNQLTGIDTGTTFANNDNGHAVQKNNGGQVTDYLYNREERLTEVKVDGTTVGQYAYNPYGQRVRKIAGGQTTWFLYNGEGLAAEYDSSGALIKEYHFKPYSPWMTEPLFQRGSDGTLYYYQNDHLGTPQRMLAKSGAVVWEAQYEAFGRAEVVVNAVENNLRFPGQYFDKETGLHHNYFRDYDPSLGRYLQKDPIGIFGGVNNYIYVYGSPVLLFDPYGLWAWGDPLPQSWVDFSAGFGDSLTFGLTKAARNGLGIDGGIDYCGGAYAAGELAELGLELALTGGSAGLRHLAGNASRSRARREFRERTSHIPRNGRQLHHTQPLFGHPGNIPTLFPTGGLPSWLNSSRWNTHSNFGFGSPQLFDQDRHNSAHRKLRKLENLAKKIVNPKATGARAALDANRGCGC